MTTRAIGPHIERSLRYVTSRSISPLREPAWLPSPRRRRAHQSRDVLRTLIMQAVVQHTQQSNGGELIDLLLDATDPETGSTLTMDDIVDELMVFLVAGHDTTATSLTAALWFLGHHPAIQDEVAVEARALSTPITMADLHQLPRVAQVLQEAMRLFPPAAALARRAEQDTTIDGWRIPKGTDVLVSIWAIHRDPAIWSQPTRFDPDRFLPELVKGRDRWAYLPFGGGPRSCIGDHFAMAEATIALATLLRRITIESVGSEFPITVPFTLTAKGPIPALVWPREWSG